MTDEVLQDKEIECKDCAKKFTFSARDQEFFKQKGFNEPKRCKECRKKRRETRDSGQPLAPMLPPTDKE